jgi:hypothetical protein
MARGDRFGAALAVVDFDGDGYDDLAIGAPGARVGKVRAAGVVVVVPGSERGLVDRVDSTWSQRRTAGERAERGDGFGSVLAANRGVLAIGVPMESAGRRRAAGVVHRIEGPTLAVHTFRRSTPKAGDLFGAAVDVDLHGKVVVGAPGVDIGGNRDAGLIALYELTRPSVAIRTVDAGDVLLGAALRAGNRFGSVVRFVGTPGAEEVFVGAPGATVAGRRGAGVVHFVDVDDVTPEQGWIRADIAGMPVGPVAGAGLGSSLSIGRRGQVVIGVPGLGPRGSGSVLIAAGPGSWQLLDQDTRGIADRAEAGDTFGATLAG